MSVSQLYVDTAALAAGGRQNLNNTCIKGSQNAVCLLFAGKATATQSIAFVVPGSVATDLVFYSKEQSATAASVINSCALTDPGLVTATWTLTLSANEAFTADLCVYRLC